MTDTVRGKIKCPLDYFFFSLIFLVKIKRNHIVIIFKILFIMFFSRLVNIALVTKKVFLIEKKNSLEYLNKQGQNEVPR